MFGLARAFWNALANGWSSAMPPIHNHEEIAPRALEPVPPWRAASVIEDLTSVATYGTMADVQPTSEVAAAGDQMCADNATFWKMLCAHDGPTEGYTVRLANFVLTEWLPLRPGLYHTDQARFARVEAIANCRILPDDARAPAPLRDLVRSEMSGRRIDNKEPFVQVFSPAGKMGMIEGGIGCIRLKPRSNRPDFPWLMGASSSGIVHEGLIVALREEQHDRFIGDVRRLGGLPCSIIGKLRFVPTDDPISRGFGRGIPQLYIEAHHLEPTKSMPLSHLPLVTAAVTFTSTLEEWKGLNAAFVTFESGKKGDAEEAADWLEQIYVRRSYAGKVLTDFDEQTGRFETATFSLARLLNGLVDRTDARAAFGDLQIARYDNIDHLEGILAARGIFVARDLYIAGQAAAMGPNATANGISFTENRSADDDKVG